jgi:hypothetical protein
MYYTAVTVRLSLNFILGVKIYTLNREDRVSEETSVTVCIPVSRAEIVGKFNTGTDREKENNSGRTKQLK